MAITIKHTHTERVIIDYHTDTLAFRETMCADMDTIAEHVCEQFIRLNDYGIADVISATTGEILLQVERS